MNTKVTNSVRIAVERSKYGIMIHIPDLPGAYTRASDENSAIAKVEGEVRRYCEWVGWNVPSQIQPLVSHRYQTDARIDDGDTEVLLHTDRTAIDPT